MSATTATVLGSRIRDARKDAGFSNQDAFAEAVGTTRRNVVRWETGKNVPGERYRRLIAEVTGRPDLFSDQDEEDE